MTAVRMSLVDVETAPVAAPRGFSFRSRGDRERLLTFYYDDLRRIARLVVRREGDKNLIEPSDLAHEAAIRMLKLDHIAFNDRAHFLAVANRIMRQILLDEVRRARATKRQAPNLEPIVISLTEPEGLRSDLDRVDEALTLLGRLDPAAARMVEQRFVTGLTIEEVARTTGVSESTVKRQWRGARTWLLNELRAD
jgi:RNA polymerase sigma factor (TIGR02999 family)